MNAKKVRILLVSVLAALWLALSLAAWFSPAEELSDAERRKLQQFPKLSTETVFTGKFMSDFETYTQDQFPGRDLFRQLKALVHYNVMLQQDNNGIYFVDDYAAKLDFPINDTQVNHGLGRLQFLYDNYLKAAGSKIYVSVVDSFAEYCTKHIHLRKLKYLINRGNTARCDDIDIFIICTS